MTEHDLRVCYETVYKMIAKERRMREAVLSGSPLLKQKLADCDTALIALTTMKDELKRHVRAGPVQEMLVDAPVTPVRIGGY